MRNVALASLVAALCGCADTLMWSARSADRSTRVSVVERGGRQRVIVGARSHEAVEAVGLESLAVSADGRTVAYPALIGGRWHLTVNGVPGAPYDGIGEVALSPDGSRVAFAAQRGGRWRVVCDGREHGDHVAIMAGSLGWSPRGRRLAYVARDEDGERVVIDGVAQSAFSAVRSIRFGDKDRRVAYVARDGSLERVVIDGASAPPSKRITELVAADDGASVAWIAERDRGADLVLDGAVIASSARGFAALRMSATGETLAALRVSARSVEATLDGRVVGTFDDAVGETFSLSADGAHLTFVAVSDGRRAVVRDGVIGPRFAAVTGLVTSDDGRWGYVGFSGEHGSVFVEGRRVRRERAWMGGLALAPSSTRYAYFVSRDRGLSVRDETRERHVGAAFTDSLTFDALGSRWGCLAGGRAGESPSVFVEGGARRVMDPGELGSLLLGGTLDADGARSIVRAELARSR